MTSKKMFEEPLLEGEKLSLSMDVKDLSQTLGHTPEWKPAINVSYETLCLTNSEQN